MAAVVEVMPRVEDSWLANDVFMVSWSSEEVGLSWFMSLLAVSFDSAMCEVVGGWTLDVAVDGASGLSSGISDISMVRLYHKILVHAELRARKKLLFFCSSFYYFSIYFCVVSHLISIFVTY